MTPANFRRLARSGDIDATIISDGCRDYLVEVRRKQGAGVLTDRKGRRKRFASLAEAKRAVKNARSIDLAMRVAADEACVGHPSLDCGFSRFALTKPKANLNSANQGA